MSDVRVEFEARLAEVKARAMALTECCDLKEQTGFEPNSAMLHDLSSRLAWANCYLTAAALKLVGETIGGKREDASMLSGEPTER